MWGGLNMPNAFSNAHPSGTEFWIDPKPGCKFEFVRCPKFYKKKCQFGPWKNLVRPFQIFLIYGLNQMKRIISLEPKTGFTSNQSKSIVWRSVKNDQFKLGLSCAKLRPASKYQLASSWGSGSGLQKDRHHGTSGAKEGFSSIGRFRKSNIFGIFWSLFLINFKILNHRFRSITLFSVYKSLNK